MVATLVTDIEIPISQEVLQLIAEIDEFKGRWRALKALAPDRLRQTQNTLPEDPNWEPWLL